MCEPRGDRASAWRSLVEPLPCAPFVHRQLRSWNAGDEVLRAPSGPNGGDVHRIATDRIGVWLTLHTAPGGGPPSLFRTDFEGTLRIDLAAQCQPTRSWLPAPATKDDGKAFTDAELRRRLTEDDRLVVYLWSPHLPLSVDGYREIETATAALRVPLVALVDPSADGGLVERIAEAEGIPRRARRPAGSIELLFRDLMVHAPAILVFAHGKASAPLPGYRRASAYREFLERLFPGAVSKPESAGAIA